MSRRLTVFLDTLFLDTLCSESPCSRVTPFGATLFRVTAGGAGSKPIRDGVTASRMTTPECM